MDKTESINDRRVDVYLDSLNQKAKWANLADEADLSLSKFVQHCVEYALSQGGPDFVEAGSAAEEIQDLKEDLREKESTINEKDMVIEKLRTELKQYRTQPFTEDDFEGRRQFDTDLIDILQNAGKIHSEEMIRKLDVDPQNTELIQAVQAQLDQLEQYGLVEETVHGWQWRG